jgi:GNAT superfamily N-acetyltransferase
MTQPEPQVWIAEPDEAETVARLLIAFRDSLGADWPSDNAFLAGVERLIDDRNSEFVLGAPTPDSPPAGVVQLRFRHSIWRAGGDALIEDLYVDPAARGAGLGRALLQYALDYARVERGCRRAELDVNEANAPALALYESLGFTAGRPAYTGRDLFMKLPLVEPGRAA